MNKLHKNVVALFFVQVFNYGLPLLAIPYLTRTLGLETYAEILYTSALAQIFFTITEFGFNLSGTRDIALNRQNKNKLIEICSTIYFIKFLLLIGCALSYLFIAVTSSHQIPAGVYFGSFLVVFGSALFPTWYFQGLERMRLMAFISVSTKSACLLSLFFLVKSSEDSVVAATLLSVNTTISGLISIIILKKDGVLHPSLPKLSSIKSAINDSKSIFGSQISNLLVSGVNTVLLSQFIGPQAAGPFALAEKIIKAANNFQSPVCTAIYPKSALLFTQDYREGIVFVKKVATIFIPLGLIAVVLLVTFSEQIIYFVSGTSNAEAIQLLKILATIPLLVFIDNLVGTQILLNTGRQKYFFIAIVIAGISSIPMSLSLTNQFGSIGTAFSYVASQMILLLSMGYFLRKPVQ